MHQADAALAFPIGALDPRPCRHDDCSTMPVDEPIAGAPAPGTLPVSNRGFLPETAKGFPLMMADVGAPVRITAVRAGKGLALRLTDLGLNVGTTLQVLQRQGSGLLVARGETRVALGGGMAAKILVAPIA